MSHCDSNHYFFINFFENFGHSSEGKFSLPKYYRNASLIYIMKFQLWPKVMR